MKTASSLRPSYFLRPSSFVLRPFSFVLRTSSFLLLTSYFLLASAALAAEPQYLASAEVTFDPPGNDGQQIVTVRMAPGVTRSYDKLRFECVYAQSAPWTNSAGVVRSKTTYAPVHFTYDREAIRLTTELDAYVSFRFPIGEDDLVTRFGPHAFRAGVPITVPCILVSGIVGERTLWTYRLPTTPGLQPVAESQRTDLKREEKPAAPKPGQSTKLGEVDLD